MSGNENQEANSRWDSDFEFVLPISILALAMSERVKPHTPKTISDKTEITSGLVCILRLLQRSMQSLTDTAILFDQASLANRKPASSNSFCMAVMNLLLFNIKAILEKNGVSVV